jgi:hypothetical protein
VISTVRRAAAVLPLLALAACGSRATLRVSPSRGGAADPPPREDAGALDAGPIADAGAPCGPPVVETCNGRDDDCDGFVDEALPFGEAAPALVVRDMEGSTGDCVSCRWAGGVDVLPFAESLVVVWRLGFDGSRPQANAFAREIGRDGFPRGEPEVLFDRNVTNGFRAAVAPDGAQASLAFCGRFGTDDVMASAYLAATPGLRLLRQPRERQPVGFGCGAMLPDGILGADTGLFGWINNRGSEEAVLLDPVDADGSSLGGRRLLDDDGDYAIPPRFARRGDDFAVVLGTRGPRRTSSLRWIGLDRFGVTTAAVEVPSDPERPFSRATLAPALDGWLIVAATDRRDAFGHFLLRVGLEGTILEGPTFIDDGVRWGSVDLEPLPGGGFALGGQIAPADGDPTVAVARLDAAGRQTDLWVPETPITFGLGGYGLVADGPLVRFAFPAPVPGDGLPNRVLLHTLGCVP